MEPGKTQELLRATCAGATYVFCAEPNGWTIRRNEAVIASGSGDRKSTDQGVKQFMTLTRPAKRMKTRTV